MYVTHTDENDEPHIHKKTERFHPHGQKEFKIQEFENQQKDFNESGINHKCPRLVCSMHIARLVSP